MIPVRSPRSLHISGLVCSNLLVFVLSGYSILQSRQQYELQAEVMTANIARAIDQNLSDSIERVDLALHTVADELERQLAVKSIDEAAMNVFLARTAKRLPDVESIRVADAAGLVMLGKGVVKQAGISWADRDYFIYHRDHADNSLQMAKPRMGRVSQQYIVGFSRRYNYPDGRFAGVVSAPMAVEHFSRTISAFDVGAHGTIVLRDIDAGLVTRFPAVPDKPVGQIGNSSFSPELRKIIDSGIRETTYYTPTSADGFKRIVTFRRLSNAPMLFIVGVASEDYLAGWKVEAYKTSALAAGFLLLSLLLGGMLLRLLAQAEQRGLVLAEREAQLRTLVEAVPDSIQFKDGEGRWLIANSVCLQLFGLEGKDWQGLTDAEIGSRHPQLASALASCAAGDDDAWAAGSVFRSDEEIVDTQGNALHFELVKVPLFDSQNNRRAMVIVGRDVSERKRSEAELERYQRHLESLVQQRTAELMATESRASHILQSSAAGLYGIDPNGLITFINPSACTTLGYQADEVIGRSAHALFHHSKADGTPYPVEDCPSHGAMQCGAKVRIDNEVYWHADGHPVPVMYATHPMIENGEITGGVTSFVDMSEQRAAALAREQALIAAENLAQVRRDFLANMSHEIRTPLNGVLGFAEIGQRNSQNSEKAHDAFGKVLVSGRRLLGVINDVLDFSKIEAGKLRIEVTDVQLAEVIDHALELVSDRARTKGLDLRVERAPDLPAACVSDPLRIGQILLNLLSNAVKFTEAGSVTLAVQCRDNKLAFRVTDTGIGMDETQLGELFNPFQQADASATRRFGGTGLGLAISKRLIDLMGGDVQVTSQPGAGTTIEFWLPYVPALEAPAGKPACAEVAQESLAGISILVVEDDRINQMVLEENLRTDGARVTIAGNGREAVECLVRDGRKAYDVVLMDIQMPEMDGYEAARQMLVLAPDLPIIAQSAHALREERDKSLAAGMVDHVTKPIDPDRLTQLIRHYAKTATSA